MTSRPVAAASGSARQIARAALLVMALFLVSRVAGLAREMIIGARFGTSAQLDAYQAAFAGAANLAQVKVVLGGQARHGG